jgi:hypothetical protein
MLRKICLFAAIALIWLVSPFAALAAVTDVDVTPTRKTLPLNRAASVTVTWTVTWFTNGSDAASPRVIFRVAGNEVGEVISPLVSLSSPESFTETIQIPLDLLRLAAEADGILEVVRVFSQTVSSEEAVLQIRVIGRLGGEPRIEQMLLRFTDLSRYRQVVPGESVQAVAELRLGNVNRLRGVWEVADPLTSQLSDPIWRVVETVNQTVAGKSEINIFSPALPQNISGPYLVRLRITDPEDVAQAPAISYYVSLSASEEIPAGPKIELDGPRDGGRVSEDTSFRWLAVDGAATYRLEIFEATALIGREASQQPLEQPLTPSSFVAGVLVPGSKTQTLLGPPTRARLSQGQTYVWRVVALDENGEEIAASKTRRMIYLP